MLQQHAKFLHVLQMGAAAAGWEASLRACLAGTGNAPMLGQLCADLASSVRLWLDLRLAQSPLSPGLLSRAVRAVQVGLMYLCTHALSVHIFSACEASVLVKRA